MKWIALFLAICSSWVHAALPTPVGEMDLGDEIGGALALASNVPIIAACVGSPCILTVIDVSSPNAPNIRGRLALESMPKGLSLSSDGRFLVALLDLEKESFQKDTRRVALGVDLSELDRPQVIWRHDFDAASTRVIPQAKGFLATVSWSAEKTTSNRWFTVLHPASFAGVGEVAVIATADYSPRPFAISKNARFVVSTDYGWAITAYDLEGKPPAVFTQGGSMPDRFGQIYGVLDSGLILIEDHRRPGIGVYAPRKDVPRIAYLGLPGNDRTVIPGQTDAALYMHRSTTGAVQQLDFSDPKNPRVVEHWSLPPSTTPIAVTSSGNMYASAGKILKIFRLDTATAPKLGWRDFERTHAQAMKAYTDPEQSEFSRHMNALRAFDQGTFLEALDSPVSGISPKRAAMMLNDYGVLVGRYSADPSDSSERALRRAIALDPTRTVAYLNLADALRARLRGVSIGKRSRSAAEIESLYRRYLSLGGRAKPTITAYLHLNPSKQTEVDSCKGIATFANAGVLQDIFVSGNNIKMGDRRIQVAVTTEGSAHVPAVYAWDMATDFGVEDLPLPENMDELWGRDNIGVITYREDIHILHYRDSRHPVASVSIGTGKSCKFQSRTREIAQPESSEPELCQRIVGGFRPPAIEFKIPAWIVHDRVREIYSETYAGKMATLDFTNDGKTSVVLSLSLASGAGAGCDAEFFDLLDPSGNRFLADERQKLLHQMQNLSAPDRYPVRPCGNQARFFRHDGNVYFESRPKKWPPTDLSDQYHLIRRIKDGKVVDACRFGFQSNVTVE